MMTNLEPSNRLTKRLHNRLIKKHLILMLYKHVGPIGYDAPHPLIKEFQEFLKEEFGVTLGYRFEDGGIYSIRSLYDKDLASDIERYEALEDLFDTETGKCKEKGEFLLETNVKYNIIEQFGKADYKRITQFLKEMKLNMPHTEEDEQT